MTRGPACRIDQQAGWTGQESVLPASKPDAMPAQNTIQHRPTRTRSQLRVYIAEDSPAIRDRLIEAIDRDARMGVVGSGASAPAVIADLDRMVVDVLILDMRLSQGSSGIEVLRHLERQAGSQRRLQIIVLTSYALPNFRQACMKLGADYFFDKSRDYERVGEVLAVLAEAGAG